MYGAELAALMKDLGAWQAFNLDGGGSTAMWLEGEGYLNQPSDGSARLVANLWGVYAGAASGQPEQPGSCFVPGGCYPAPLAGTEEETFKDLPASAPGHDEINALYERGAAEACSTSPDLMFCPSCQMTRAGFATMLGRALELDSSSPPAEATFTDVPVDHPAFAEIEAAAAAGFALQCGAGTFCPEDGLTRGEGAAFVATAMTWSTEAPSSPTFTDVTSAHVAYGDVEALAAHCASEACAESADAFCPDDGLLRSDAAVFVARALGGCGSSGSGGAPGTGGSSASAGGGGAASDDGGSADGGGCGCRVESKDSNAGLAGLAGLMALFAMHRRGRRSRR